MTLGILSHQLEIGGDPTAADAPGAYDSADSAPERGQWCEHQGSPVLPAELSVVSPWLPVVVSKIPSIPGDFYHPWLKDAQDLLAWSLGVCLPNWRNWTKPYIIIYHIWSTLVWMAIWP